MVADVLLITGFSISCGESLQLKQGSLVIMGAINLIRRTVELAMRGIDTIEPTHNKLKQLGCLLLFKLQPQPQEDARQTECQIKKNNMCVRIGPGGLHVILGVPLTSGTYSFTAPKTSARNLLAPDISSKNAVVYAGDLTTLSGRHSTVGTGNECHLLNYKQQQAIYLHSVGYPVRTQNGYMVNGLPSMGHILRHQIRDLPRTPP